SAIRRGAAERAAQVRALGERTHAGGEGNGGPAARAAGGEGEVPRVPRGPEHSVGGVGTEGELRRVRLAQDDGAGRLQTLDDHGVFVRHVLLEERSEER